MQVMMNCGLAAGATLVTMPRFDLELFLRAHQQHRVTFSYVAPPIVVALAKHPMVAQYDLGSLRFMLSGAAPLSAELAAEAGHRIGCEIVQGYGMTELSPVSHFTPPGRNRPGASGLTVPNTECRIVDPASGASLGPGEDGELWIRGPQVMRGYLNQPEATAATLDGEGWLHTGDIAHFDADGYLFIVDRLKELIKYKAFQVPPAELEALLLSHPAIADAAVVGLPDEEAGELPVGFVVLKPGAQASAAEIMAFVAGQVAHYKQLRRVTFIDAVPKSASGKILRRLLRDAPG
jgi:4-coumarate--CoA ligase